MTEEEDIAKMKILILQDARWGLVQMCGTGGGPEKVERNT